MKKVCYYILMGLGLLAVSCSKEADRLQTGVPEGEPVELCLSFNGSGENIIEPTKSTQSLTAESSVYNLYVFIFDMGNNGKKLYGHYFDYTNLSTTGASTLKEWWEVKNNETVGDVTTTSGEIHLHTISKSNCTVVAIANIDAEMVNISPEQLSAVESYEDLYAQQATLNQLIVSRSSYFPMSGKVTGVDTGYESGWGSIVLSRLDAKISFNVYVDLQDGKSPIEEFEPLKWQVVNIPKTAYILEHGAYNSGSFQQSDLQDASISESDFFDLGETNFETETVTESYYAESTLNRKLIHGFSFYMLENRKAPRASMGSSPQYAYRELQDKNNVTVSDIAHAKNGAFTYAPELATYVIITGRVRMSNTQYKESTGATLSADVKYVVHLGDFSNGKYEDFNIFRNHSYVYDIVIRNVDDIRTEVTNNYEGETQAEKLAEPEPGASGNVTVAMEEVFPCDAHYASHVITFHAKHIDADKVSWLVKTPFNPSGASPVQSTNGVEITTGIDFEWVEFRLNDMDENGEYFDEKRQVYKPMSGEYADGKTMNISGLVAYLKKQKRLYDDENTRASSDFDATPAEKGGPKISVTAFVNEYYYEKNPITSEVQSDLWKRFVNQPMRYMYILSETQTSADGESQIIGASFTIQQKSIQSIYNIESPDLYSAWGGEHEDDEQERGFGKYEKSGSGNLGNSSLSNGRLNTLKLWTLLKPDGSNNIMGEVTNDAAYWHHYMDLTAANDVPIMKSDYQYLRFSCMSRNRDNNGNGLIDLDEVRWYMGSRNQLVGLFIGDYGIEGDARLYQRNAQEKASLDKEVWRQHILASTKYNNNNGPYVIWGEEGLSYGSTGDSWQYAKISTFSTRCLRNLGYDPDSGLDMTYAPETAEPEDYIVVKRLLNGQDYDGDFTDYVYYEFDCTRLNEASLRYYTNRELSAHDEESEQASLYKSFATHPRKMVVNVNNLPPPQNSCVYINTINEYLNTNVGENPFCPSGYRLPNIRELAVMRYFIPSDDINSVFSANAPSRTHWSFGLVGAFYNSGRGTENRYGWGASKEKIFMMDRNNQKVDYPRCVKDVKQ